MTILGKYTKQPQEVEVYSISFYEQIEVTDSLSGAWTMIAPQSFAKWDGVTLAAPYTALLADDSRQLVSTANVTLPTGAPDGYRLPVANASQSTAITVGGFNVPARGSILIARVAGAWLVETSTTSVLINAPGDQRVRTFVSGGANLQTYEIQTTVDTAEGRRLQDEFIVRIKEV